MRIQKVTKETNDQYRKGIIQFIEKYGDNHITKKAIRWLKQTPFRQFHFEQGDLLYVMIEKNIIVGVKVIANYGFRQAFIVVHPKVRKSGVALQLVTEAQKELNRFYVKVANDNVPSLKLCFAAGLQAFDLTKGPTGKPTLILGSGEWNKEDWEKHKEI